MLYASRSSATTASSIECLVSTQPFNYDVYCVILKTAICCRSGQCDRRCVYPNGTLVIRKFRSNFEGDYECFAKQEGYESQSVSVNLKLACKQSEL